MAWLGLGWMEKGLKLPRGVKGVHWPDQSPPCPGISANASTRRGTSYGGGGRGGPGQFSCLQGGQVQEAGLGRELGDPELLSDSPFCSRTRTGHDCSLRLWSLDNKTCAVGGKGLILRRRGNHVAFLELWRDSRISTGNTIFLMCRPREVLSSIRVSRDSWRLPSSHCRAK